MELIATARFKKAMDRAHAASDYTRRITGLVADLARSGLEVSHPLLTPREDVRRARLLVLSANRGLCGGYNAGVLRLAYARWAELGREVPETVLEVSGKRGISAFRFRKITPADVYTHFEDKPSFDQVNVLADRYLDEYAAGRMDRLDVAYTRFESLGRQAAAVETLLPMSELGGTAAEDNNNELPQYEFLPSAASILEEVVPTAFKVKLFKCFLDAAVSEQIARMVAMKAATENADAMISSLSITYNRARQTQITSELLEVVGGSEAVG